MLSKIKRWWFGPPIEELFTKYPDFTEFCEQDPMKSWDDVKKFELTLGEDYLKIYCGGSLFNRCTHVWVVEYELPKKIERDLVRIAEYFRWQYANKINKERALRQSTLDERIVEHWPDTQKDPMLNTEMETTR